MKITYTSDTGKTFDTEAECRADEASEVASLVAEVTSLLGDRDGVVRAGGLTCCYGFAAVEVLTATLRFFRVVDMYGSPDRKYLVVDRTRSAEGSAATLRGAYGALVQELASGTDVTKRIVRDARRELERALDKLNAEIHRSKDLLSYLGAPTP